MASSESVDGGAAGTTAERVGALGFAERMAVDCAASGVTNIAASAIVRTGRSIGLSQLAVSYC
jgi:hypothetical protein